MGMGAAGLLPWVLAATPDVCASLEGRLCGLAPKLGSVAVLLRTLVLPALPWLALDARERVQVGVQARRTCVCVELYLHVCTCVYCGSMWAGCWCVCHCRTGARGMCVNFLDGGIIGSGWS